MSKLMELFVVLDKCDLSHFPSGIQLNPDPAIQAARLALNGKEDSRAALRQVQEQIATYRSAKRAVDFDLVDLTQTLNLWPPEKLRQLGVDLHQYAARLNMLLTRWEEARSHLLQAVAINPQDPDPRSNFAELYERTGAFVDAFNMLEDTFNLFVQEENGSYQLYSLCLSIQLSGALEDARRSYTRLIARNPSDLFAGLAKLQLIHLDSGSSAQLSDSELHSLYRRAAYLLTNGNPVGAAIAFSQFLSWVPNHPLAWYGLGSANKKQVLLTPMQEILTPDLLSEADYSFLIQAEQAFRFAIMLNPDLAIAHDGRANCLLLLNRYAEAQEAIFTALKAESGNPVILYDAARILWANGKVQDALGALQASLKIEPNQREANEFMNWLAHLPTLKD